MSYKINILPSGHQFEAETHESVLEAALRSGLNLSYHCNTGSCGECKARVVDGVVETCHHYDFVIPEAEKLRNNVLLCSVSARSDLVVEAMEALAAKDIPLQTISVKVAKVEFIGEHNLVLHLRTPRSKTLRFLAGQYVELRSADLPAMRFYVASCPCNGMIIQLHLQRESNNPFIAHVFQGIQVGQSLELVGPYGEFTLNEQSQRPIVMVAQDIDFAPIKSLIEHAIALDLTQSMYLFRLSGKGKGHYQSNYCRAWEDALDCFIYRPFELTPLDSGKQQYTTAIDYVLGRSPIETEISLYLSGPQPMLAAFTSAFTARGTPRSQIYTAASL